MARGQHVRAEHPNRSLVRQQQAEEDGEGRRLAGAVAAQKGGRGPAPDGEAERVDGGGAVEALRQSVDFDGEGSRHDGQYESGRADRPDRKSTSELQSLMRISYAVFCLKKKKKN